MDDPAIVARRSRRIHNLLATLLLSQGAPMLQAGDGLRRSQRVDAGFARPLRAVMRHAGMIRIDHALGPMRAFWIPGGATDGAHVRRRLDALLAATAIESARTRCVAIGEDLGLVPAGRRDALAASGVHGQDVLQ